MTTPNTSVAAAGATGTVTLHRVLRAPAERIYRAFLDADAMCKWLPPHGFTGRVLSLDADGEVRHAEARVGLGCGKAAGRREHRQRRATERQHEDEQQGREARPAVQQADHRQEDLTSSR